MSDTDTNNDPPDTPVSRAVSEQAEPVIYTRDKHCISRANIDPDALKIMYRLNRHNFSAYLVGGGVRDLLLGKKPKDFDIATDATPRKIKSLFRNCRIIGRRFKLAHIYFRNHKIIEVSTFRDFSDPIDLQDEEEKDKHVLKRDNNYGTAATDALRRDITINALFYDLSTFSIIDYVGGIEDLNAKIVKVIGDPDERFAEDPVRLMRTVRHAARSGFRIEESCYESIVRNREFMSESSPVRIYEELKKDFCSGHSLGILRLLHRTYLLDYLVPELAEHDGIFLRDEHPFSQCMKRVDETWNSGREPPLTSILALLAITFSSPDLEIANLPQLFADRRKLFTYLEECFRKLAVPRKERERIADTLALWHLLVTSDRERVRSLNLQRRKYLEQVYWLLYFLQEEDEQDEIFQIVSDKWMEREETGKGERNQRGRPRGRGRGRSQSKKRSPKRKSGKRRSS